MRMSVRRSVRRSVHPDHFTFSWLWDLIETWGFRVDDPYDLPDSSTSSADKFTKPNLTKPLQISDFWAYLSFGT